MSTYADCTGACRGNVNATICKSCQDAFKKMLEDEEAKGNYIRQGKTTRKIKDIRISQSYSDVQRNVFTVDIIEEIKTTTMKTTLIKTIWLDMLDADNHLDILKEQKRKFGFAPCYYYFTFWDTDQDEDLLRLCLSTDPSAYFFIQASTPERLALAIDFIIQVNNHLEIQQVEQYAKGVVKVVL